jgi:hypothetical protein
VSATALGQWLVGVGSFAAIMSVLLDPPSKGVGGLVFGSQETARPERIRHAVLLTSLVFVAAGSLIVAATILPEWYVAVATVLAFGAGVWLVCAWSQHRAWAAHLAEARRGASDENASAYPMMGYTLRCAEHCARWSWALRHPFNGDTWPSDFARRELLPATTAGPDRPDIRS